MDEANGVARRALMRFFSGAVVALAARPVLAALAPPAGVSDKPSQPMPALIDRLCFQTPVAAEYMDVAEYRGCFMDALFLNRPPSPDYTDLGSVTAWKARVGGRVFGSAVEFSEYRPGSRTIDPRLRHDAWLACYDAFKRTVDAVLGGGEVLA